MCWNLKQWGSLEHNNHQPLVHYNFGKRWWILTILINNCFDNTHCKDRKTSPVLKKYQTFGKLQRPYLAHKFLVSITLAPTFKHKIGSSPPNSSEDNLFAFLLLWFVFIVIKGCPFLSNILQLYADTDLFVLANLVVFFFYFIRAKIGNVAAIQQLPI